MKVVLNKCFGGFSLSEKAYEHLGIAWDGNGHGDFARCDQKLVECVEALGDLASGTHSKLVVVDIPGDIEWTITEYDGIELLREAHRIW